MSTYLDDEEILDEEELLNEDEGPGPIPDRVLASAAQEPAPPKASAPEAAPPIPAQESVADFIAFKRLLGDDAKALEAARKAARERIREANQMQAIGDLGAGLAGVKVDPGYYNTVREQDQAEIKGAESDLERQRRLVQEFIADKRAGQGMDLRSRTLDEQIRHNKAMEGVAGRKAAATGAKPSKAQEAVDRNYGDRYNSWTEKGRNNAANAIAKLESLAAEMEADKGLLQSGGGRIAAELPDFARSRDAIRRRDDTRNAANTTLKELFGGQLSDAEREAAAKEYYNDALDNEANAKILRRKIDELKSNMRAQEEKAKYFEREGTLMGFQGTAKPAGTGKKPKWAK
jgi:hypothetical protein